MPVQLRPYHSVTDAQEFMALYSRLRAQETTLERFLDQERQWPAQLVLERHVAHLDGQLLGLADLRSFEYIPPGWLLLTLGLAPQGGGKRLGDQLLRWAETQALQRGAAGIVTNVLDHDPASRGWAERRGYRLHAHRFASELDLRRPQPTPHWPDGLHPRDMTGASDEEWRQLETLYGDLLAHTPDLQGQPRWTPQQLHAALGGSSRMRPDWVVRAMRGPEVVGLAVGFPITTGIYNEFTGVVPDLRGQGVARMLKLNLSGGHRPRASR
ncbi:GNAT family N-acetyltransferase [Deinococcus sonorensis]|uniref:GNAT family N-acetyltransferase n=2 Tax=Deinococcus sonorensis TaxID=309891 RepID=A0AAU7UD65_9DEIO